MKKDLFFVFILFFAFGLGCSREEILYDVPPSPRYFYFVTGDNPNKIGILEVPTHSITEQNAYFKVNGINLDTITQISEFRGSLFILQSNSNIISVANASNLSKLVEIGFGNKTPSGIAFPNATAAFVSFSNSSTVDLIDLTNFQLARTIQVPYNSGKAIAVQHFIFILHPENNLVSIIDSRTFSVFETITLPEVPIDIETNVSFDAVYILCIGKGKIDSVGAKTSSKIVLINLNDFSKQQVFEINVSSLVSADIFPLGLTIPNKYFGYIATKQGLLRFSLSNPRQFQKILSGTFYNVNYNYKADELIILESKNNQTVVYFANPTSFEIKSRFTIDKNIQLILPK